MSTSSTSEAGYVGKALADLRQVVMAFVGGLNRTLVEDGLHDSSFRRQLERLSVAAKRDSVEALRREAPGTVETMTALLEQRRRATKADRAKLAEQVQALGSALETAKREGSIDGLTQLQNRKAFDARIADTHGLQMLFGRVATLLMIDIDHFKLLNDRHGHPAGDAVLRAVADTVSRTFLRRNDFVARYGGEELAVVLPDTSAKDALAMAERLLRLVRALTVSHQGTILKVTVSIGVADSATSSHEDWVERADRALYLAKDRGRDRVVEAPGEGRDASMAPASGPDGRSTALAPR